MENEIPSLEKSQNFSLRNQSYQEHETKSGDENVDIDECEHELDKNLSNVL